MHKLRRFLGPGAGALCKRDRAPTGVATGVRVSPNWSWMQELRGHFITRFLESRAVVRAQKTRTTYRSRPHSLMVDAVITGWTGNPGSGC